MTAVDGRGGILLVAILVSSALHFGAMFYARPRVMTQVTSETVRKARRESMHVTKQRLRPDPVRIDTVRDIDALKDAPVVEEMDTLPEISALADALSEKLAAPAPVTEVPEALQPKIEAAVLDAKVIGSDRSDRRVERERPMPVETVPVPKAAPVGAAPASALPVPKVALDPGPAVPPPVMGADEILASPKIVNDKDVVIGDELAKFKPVDVVHEKVDEAVVEREKKAVKELLDISDAGELKDCVNVAMTKAVDGKWMYFKVKLLPRENLPVVPKDVVVLIDASGSIGKDRMASVREAAKRLLRSSTNSGDRFNLVAFRDRYSYAFRRWQECTQTSFNAAEAWLDDVAAHGRTDVFATIASVLTLPRDPARPLVALVVTDGDANAGVRGTADIISKFTALNDGLISVYMYGVRHSANRELIDVLTRGNRGESFIYDGWVRRDAASGLEGLCERFRDPVLSDLRVVFLSGVRAEAYPRLLRNLYRGGSLELFGRVPSGTREVAFSLKGLNGKDPYEGFFKIDLATVAEDGAVADAWNEERKIDLKLK